MSTILLIYSSVVWFFAGFINGVTSFGGNMVAVPFLSLVLDPRQAIIFTCLTGTAITASIAVLYFGSLLKKEFFMATACCAAGVPAGMWVLKVAPVKLLLFLAGAIITLFLVWQFVAKRLGRKTQIPLWCIVPAGLLSGVLLGCVGMGGPIMAMYGVLRGWSKEASLSMLNSMAALSMFFLIALQWSQGLYTPEILEGSAWGIPCTIAGVLVSLPVIRRMDPHIFRLGLLGMLALSAGMLFYRCLT